MGDWKYIYSLDSLNLLLECMSVVVFPMFALDSNGISGAKSQQR